MTHLGALFLQFGKVQVEVAQYLNCISPCGQHGMKAPKVNNLTGDIMCMCECEEGWSTDPSQGLEDFVHCSMSQATTNQSTEAGSVSPTYPRTYNLFFYLSIASIHTVCALMDHEFITVLSLCPSSLNRN